MESIRGLLTTYAYNICGSLEEARDIVQDVFLRFMQLDTTDIIDKNAYLKRMVINLSVNRKKAMQKQLKAYRGEWLPEPVATESADGHIYRKEILSYSLMVLLEKLNAKQRAVFILKEAFDYDHTEIAEVLGIQTEYSRQLLTRAKKQLHALPPVDHEFNPPTLLNRYLEVIRLGDTQKLETLLSEDIVVTSDGGGKASAGLKPIYGKASATAFLQGIFKKFYCDRHIEERFINHQPALLYYEENVLVNCQIFSLDNGYVSNIFFIRNPDKLKLLQKASHSPS